MNIKGGAKIMRALGRKEKKKKRFDPFRRAKTRLKKEKSKIVYRSALLGGVAGGVAGGATGYAMESLLEDINEFGISAARRLRHLKLKANRKLKGRELSPQARLHMQNVGEAKSSWFGKDMKPRDVVRKQKQIRKADQQTQNKSNKLVIGAGVIPPVLATGASIGATVHYSKKRK